MLWTRNNRALMIRLLLGMLVSSLQSVLFGQTFEWVATNVPGSELVKGIDGDFYGATTEGGNPWVGFTTTGTIFKLTPGGVVSTLVEFDGIAGGEAYGGLILGADGSLYGTTLNGGDLSVNNGLGYGTVFKMSPDTSLSGLASFESFCGNDFGHRSSTGMLLQGKDGNLYGTITGNLISDYGSIVPGSVFKLTPDGTLTTLATFNESNGSYPNGGLVQGNDGNLYGTTMTGGNLWEKWAPGGTDYSIVTGFGTVFKLTPDGVLTTLVKFNGSNGAYPRDGLIQGSDGAFYGTTSFGGAFSGGTVFKLTPDGLLTTLVSFTVPSNPPQGAFPFTGPWERLVQAHDGNFYGTTRGWPFWAQGGTVFQITPAGGLTTLMTFTNGLEPAGALVEGDDGNLYGLAGAFFRVIISALPTLHLERNASQLVLSWPTNTAVAWTLQSSPDLSSATNWTDVALSPAIVGDQYSVTNTASGTARFYRLRTTLPQLNSAAGRE